MLSALHRKGTVWNRSDRGAWRAVGGGRGVGRGAAKGPGLASHSQVAVFPPEYRVTKQGGAGRGGLCQGRVPSCPAGGRPRGRQLSVAS